MNTKQWFEVCKPNPSKEQACVQVGVHIEEFAEMLSALGWRVHAKKIHELADKYKQKWPCCVESIDNSDRVELLDSIIDQNVTGQGVCHTLKMDHEGALVEVESSNESKLEDGKPVFDDNGKITKGKNYVKPNLERFV